ncbi:sex hormone-binding globulin [Xyrichtys novacula]|nr:sex hormone-binding globulin [Xyrichtys novacula]
MQISKEDMLVSVTGGPKLNDGKWHTLEVSNQGKFVVLEVDGSSGLVVGMQSKKEELPISSELRLALGGVLIGPEKLIVQFEPQMDGCVREGSWLNLSVPWEAVTEELWPCYQNVRPGSYFSGMGFAVFNTSVFPIKADDGVTFELWGDLTNMDGTIMSIKAPEQQLMFAIVANKNTKEVTLTFGVEQFTMTDAFERLVITFQTDLMQVIQVGDESKTTRFPISPTDQPAYLSAWAEGHLAFGGLLGEGEDNTGSQFLTGCLERIQVQARDLDLDFAVKHSSISSHSCPE